MLEYIVSKYNWKIEINFLSKTWKQERNSLLSPIEFFLFY